MKTLGLVLALVVVAGGACVADTASFDVLANWNCISAPLVPFNPDPLSVFTGINVVGTLSRYDAPSQGGIAYDDLDPAAFGNILLGDGYWLLSDGTYTVSYDGVPDGVPDGSGNMTDMWVSLPGYQLDTDDAGGWHLIGQPFNHDTAVDAGSMTGDNLFLTDGTTLKTWGEAAGAGWCDAVLTAFDPNTQGQYTVGFDLADDDHIRPGKGYWFLTYKDNLALIIPAQPS